MFTKPPGNIDEVSIPASFGQLGRFLQQNYSGPDYYVLVLPLSTIGAQSVELGPGFFRGLEFAACDLRSLPSLMGEHLGARPEPG